jgi:hypothetical protein
VPVGMARVQSRTRPRTPHLRFRPAHPARTRFPHRAGVQRTVVVRKPQNAAPRIRAGHARYGPRIGRGSCRVAGPGGDALANVHHDGVAISDLSR